VKPLDVRGLLCGELSIPDKKITLFAMATHLGLLQFERHRQLKRIIEYIQRHVPAHSPCFLGGDFNDWRLVVSKGLAKRVGMHEAFRTQERRHARTFPSRLPILPLDRIYYRSLSLVRARVLKGKPWHLLSDHLPIVADFRLPE